MPRRLRHLRRLPRALALLLGLLAALPACSPLADPVAQAELQTAMEEIRDVVMDARDEVAVLQVQVDSLKEVVARQDTVLRQVANLTGVRVR